LNIFRQVHEVVDSRDAREVSTNPIDITTGLICDTSYLSFTDTAGSTTGTTGTTSGTTIRTSTTSTTFRTGTTGTTFRTGPLAKEGKIPSLKAFCTLLNVGSSIHVKVGVARDDN
tara:strand:+ start:1863 stop:2207 length:345 start_codon:yes stop_codon:yes gene_type:complete